MSLDEHIYVVTRRGVKEQLNIGKIKDRIDELVKRAPEITGIDVESLVMHVVKNMKNNMTTSEIDNYTANTCATMSISNPKLGKLAARIVVDDHQKNTMRSFVDKMKECYINQQGAVLSKEFIEYVEKHGDVIESMIDYKRDFAFDLFGMRTYQRQFGIVKNGKVIERPQDTFMRVAVAINMGEANSTEQELADIKVTYDALSNKYYTHASPTYYNAGCVSGQLASCFLLGVDDSLESIEKMRTNVARISKWAGGIGINIGDIRARGSIISTTNGVSTGICAPIRCVNTTVEMYNQGGRRPGSAKMYLPMHHPDIEDFLKLKRPTSSEETRAKSLFYALWVSDLFMKRVKNDEIWSLFNPHTNKQLNEVYGDEYEKLYVKLESEKKYSKQLSARDLWKYIYEINRETGTPDIVFADAANRANMQSNMGILKNSNLCDEIFQFSSNNEYGVCILSSINLSAFVKTTDTSHTFDFKKLIEITRLVCRNLNHLIDKTYHPTEESHRGAMMQRAIGIGVQGLANTFIMMKMPFESNEAKELNKLIFETIYYAAVTESCELARQEYFELKKINPDVATHAGAYPRFVGSPWQQGKLNFDFYPDAKISNRYDWDTLRAKIAKFGVRNSLLTALMPTASTSQLLGNNECFEPFTSNLYKRQTLTGEFIIMNKYLVEDLTQLDLWNKNIKDYLLISGGSVQHINGLSQEFKNLYKTVWEMDYTNIVNMAGDRQPFIDQGQSLNVFLPVFTEKEWNKIIFQGWKAKLKTGKYYVYVGKIEKPLYFSIDVKQEQLIKEMMAKHTINGTNEKNDVACDSCGA